MEWRNSFEILKILQKEWIDKILTNTNFYNILKNTIQDINDFTKKILDFLSNSKWDILLENNDISKVANDSFFISLLDFFTWINWWQEWISKKFVKWWKISISNEDLNKIMDEIIKQKYLFKTIISEWESIIKKLNGWIKKNKPFSWIELGILSSEINSYINKIDIFKNVDYEIVNEKLWDLYSFEDYKNVIKNNWAIWDKWDIAVIVDWIYWSFLIYINNNWFKVFNLTWNSNWPHVNKNWQVC